MRFSDLQFMSAFGFSSFPDFSVNLSPSTIYSHVPHRKSPYFLTLFVSLEEKRAFVSRFFKFGACLLLFMMWVSFTNSFMFSDRCSIGKKRFAVPKILWLFGLWVTTKGIFSLSSSFLRLGFRSSVIGICLAISIPALIRGSGYFCRLR